MTKGLHSSRAIISCQKVPADASILPRLARNWKLDRLSRSLKDLLHVMDCIELAKAGFRSITEAIDTTTPAGRMMMQMLGAFAEFERAMTRERTRAGLDVARQKGRIGGRRSKLNQEQKRKRAGWWPAGRSRRLTWPGCSTSTRPPFPG